MRADAKTLQRAAVPLVAVVELDDVTADALRPFDLDPAAPTLFYPWLVPTDLPLTWGVGLIVGASGTGKSLLLRAFGTPAQPTWQPRRSIASHFASGDEAASRFYAVGLNSVPTWRQPYAALSNGQQFRADLARQLVDGAVVDEYTSVVDRNVAAGASRALSSHVARTGLQRLVLATCHRDVEAWLRPDWVIDTDAGTLTVGQAAERPRWYLDSITGGPDGRLTLR